MFVNHSPESSARNRPSLKKKKKIFVSDDSDTDDDVPLASVSK
jgi:hypothetical protein